MLHLSEGSKTALELLWSVSSPATQDILHDYFMITSWLPDDICGVQNERMKIPDFLLSVNIEKQSLWLGREA